MQDAQERELIGTGQLMTKLRHQIKQVAPTDAKVLITGDSGVGKELVARGLHAQSARRGGAFVAVNCAGLPESLLESELFGHTKGSFTGAFRDQAGKLETADRGTVFMDELGEMTLRMQALLLRFLETGEIQKVGMEEMVRKVDVRIIAATNQDLAALVRSGSFREDLYYRLRVIHIHVPALRERSKDIPELVHRFLDRVKQRTPTVVSDVSPEAMDILTRYSWPGNVRELENVLERLVITGQDPVIQPADLPPELLPPAERARVLQERRRTVADDLYQRLTEEGRCFWTTVYPLYMQREITRGNVRDLVRRGLEETCGSYRVVARMFNMDDGDYKRFLNFLRKHDCQVPFREYRLQSSDEASL